MEWHDMDDALWKLVGFLLSAVLLFAIPTMALLERQDDITRALVQTEVNRFVDTSRDMGYISPQLYSRFTDRLGATGLRYNIKLRHEKRTWIPVYENVGAGLVFQGEYDQSRVMEGEATVLSTLYPNNTVSVDDKQRQYPLHQGDMLFVEVQSTGETMAGSLRRLIYFGRETSSGILARAGGMVRNEAD